MKKEEIDLLRKMKNGSVDKEKASKIFNTYQVKEKEYWLKPRKHKIASLFIETMLDIIDNREKKESEKKVSEQEEVEKEYEIGDIYYLNFFINHKEEANFFHPAIIINKNEDFYYVAIGTTRIHSSEAFHYKDNKEISKSKFLIKNFESKYEKSSLDYNTVFILNNIRSIKESRLQNSKFLGTIRHREHILPELEKYIKELFQ